MEVLEKYGVTFASGVTDAQAELYMAFDINGGQPSLHTSKGFLGAFEHLQRAIDLIYNAREYSLIWNDWTEGMLREMIESGEWVISGPSSCVAGHTRIWNPVTNESPTIKELFESQIAPVVMTLNGPIQAEIPFIKGFNDLYEIVLDSGSRFYATSEHRVLCPEGYIRVGSLSIGSLLFGYSQSLQDSISGNDLLTHALDAHDSQKTVEDSQVDYRFGYHFDDEQLLPSISNGQSSFPLQADVQEHNRSLLRSDDRASVFLYNHPRLPSDLLSSSKPFPASILWNDSVECLVHPRILPHAACSFLPFGQSRSKYNLTSTFFQPVLDFSQQHSYQTKVHEDIVVSIRRTYKDFYYDISVPNEQHYYAEGIIHHNSWKSTCAACYGHAFWLADPLNTKVIPNSTTLGGLRERIWKDILKFHRAANPGFGNVVNHPTPKIQTVRGDDSSGIHGIAVEQGDIEKAIDKIRGRHKPRMLVLIDEGTGAQQAIVDSCLNLQTGCERFQLGMLGNPSSYFDQHGRLSEPESGWNSVTVETEKWKTKRGGICIHLDGLKAPNVLAGKKKYPGMISQDDIDLAAKQYGENSPRFWQERRGFWPPEGLTKTVLTEAIIVKFKARERPVWVGQPVKIAAADPSFEGGDLKPLGFANVGMIDDVNEEGNHYHHVVLCFDELLILKVDVTSKEPIHFQLARQYREECKARGVEPYQFGLDTTGEGGGVESILKREWSEEILSVEFGGRASDRPISDVNPRKGYEEYYDKVTELWYQFRAAAERNQIRGMPVQMCKEFCQRNYDMAGSRIWVESKRKMKARIGHSPDIGDFGAIMVEVALRLGLLFGDIMRTSPSRGDDWQDFAKQMIPLSRYASA